MKPLDEKLLIDWIARSKLVVTVEENTLCGGFGSAVLELMQKKDLRQSVLCLGLPDLFIDHASPAIQKKSVGLDAASISEKILNRMKELESSNRPGRSQPAAEAPLVLN